MKFRIGLLTKLPTGKSDTLFVEAANASEMKSVLAGLGAKNVGLYYRDRIGDGHLDGVVFPVESLDDGKFDWVVKAPAATVRQFYYEK